MMQENTHYYESSALFHGSLMNVMGTRLDALLLGDTRAGAQSIWREIVTELARLEKMLSKFDQTGELGRLNQNAPQAPAPVSEELWDILTQCRAYYDKTQGYFDTSLTHHNQIHLDTTNKTIRFESRAVSLDLGGFAKGYALEKIRSILTTQGITRALINFGNSSVLALGTHPHGDCWAVGINDPYQPDRTIHTIRLKDATLSTSGNMPSHTGHILNPRTGLYSTERKIVTVVSPNAIAAEALSTALMVAGKENEASVAEAFPQEKFYTFYF